MPVGTPRYERSGTGLLYAAVIFGIGCILWVPLARGAYFMVSATTRDLIESGSFIINEPQFRMHLVISGAKGMAVMGAIFASVLVLSSRLGRTWPVWACGLAAIVVGVIVAAFFVPPDVVAQLVWIGCAVMGVVQAGLLQRRRMHSG